MADLLRRAVAPLTAEAWSEIDESARRVFRAQLSARTLVDFNGPYGWEYAAVNTGRMEVAKKAAPGNLPWGTRQVQPLIELRVPCSLNWFELDYISRGAQDPDLSTLEDTARRVALFEETALYSGFAPGQIQGLLGAATHSPIKLPATAEEYPAAVAKAVRTLKAAGIEGPYALVLGDDPYYALMQAGKGSYPPRRTVKDLIDGAILRSPALTGGVLLSRRGGDFELTVGQDLAIGYVSHTSDTINLFIAESFTFRVLEPAAAVELQVAKK